MNVMASVVVLGCAGVAVAAPTESLNEWIVNGDANFAYTIGSSALLDPEGGAAVAFLNSSAADFSGEGVAARIAIVPAPASALVLSLSGLMAGRRRR